MYLVYNFLNFTSCTFRNKFKSYSLSLLLQKILSVTEPANLEQLDLGVNDSIVCLKCDTLNSDLVVKGYGIIFNKSGWIITCYHILSDYDKFIAKTINGCHTFPVELFEFDVKLDLAVLKPANESTSDLDILKLFNVSETFKYLGFSESVNFTHSRHNQFFIVASNGCIVKSEGNFHNEIVSQDNVRFTKMVIYREMCSKDAVIQSGGPVVIKNNQVLGLVNLSFGSSSPSSNAIVGIACDTLKFYTDYIDKIWPKMKKLVRDLVADYKFLVLCKVDELQYAKDINNRESKCYKYFDTFKDGYATVLELNHSWTQLVEKLTVLAERVAPGSLNFEIHLSVKPKSFLQKDQTIYKICELFHLNFDNIFREVKFADATSYVLESWKWFLIWNTKLKEREDDFKRMLNANNSIIDALFSVQLLSGEEYHAIKTEQITNYARANKFIAIISRRYPSDIDFIIEALLVRELEEEANVLKELKEDTLQSADPYTVSKCLNKDLNPEIIGISHSFKFNSAKIGVSDYSSKYSSAESCVSDYSSKYSSADSGVSGYSSKVSPVEIGIICYSTEFSSEDTGSNSPSTKRLPGKKIKISKQLASSLSPLTIAEYQLVTSR